MYPILHVLLVAAYAMTPLAALGLAFYLARRSKRRTPLAGFVLTCCSAAILGVAVVVLHSVWSDARYASPSQLFISVYVMIGMLCAIKTLSWGTQWAMARALRMKPTETKWRRGKQLASMAVQIVVMVGFGLPYVVATLATFRPRVGSVTPAALGNIAFDEVRFPAAVDSTKIAGYWIGVAPPPLQTSAQRLRNWGTRTVILCGGDEEQKSDQGRLIRQIVAGGYNVLAIDCRGHGDSGGQWSSFGDLERRDVLGAVRWVKDAHGQQSVHVYALGIGTGAAAVIGAAVDSSSPGGQIDAVAVIAGFADLRPVMWNVLRQHFSGPLGWLIMRVGMPIASAHAGADLAHFSPGAMVGDIWPRPFLVIHGRGDAWVPIEQGEALFDKASPPRINLYLNTGHSGTFRDESTGRVLLHFFDTAQPLPII